MKSFLSNVSSWHSRYFKARGLAGLTSKLCRVTALELLKCPNITIRRYVRDHSKVPQEIASKYRVQIFQGLALDRAAAQTSVHGCHVVVCGYLGPDEIIIERQKTFVDASKVEGVSHYFTSDFTLG